MHTHTHRIPVIGTLCCLAVIVGLAAVPSSQIEALECVGKPYAYPGCPLFEEPSETPQTCGNNIVDEGEECDMGRFNGQRNCSTTCRLLYCGDGKVSGDLGEECEPEAQIVYARDPETGELTTERHLIAQACGDYCTVPTCDAQGYCSGGCKRKFASACPVSSSHASVRTQRSARSQVAVVSVREETSEADTSLTTREPMEAAAPPAAAPLRPPTCGNGRVDEGEQCDDGNQIQTDTCTSFCHVPACGDGILHFGEQCDDGNAINTDSCTAQCQFARCGDGVVQMGEQCDDGNAINTDSCTAQCQFARCGDGVVQMGEQCDDGNQINTDSCTNTCRAPGCGDGIVQPGEECDDGNSVNTDSCSNACLAARCGDRIIQIGEECDDGNSFDEDVCTSSCRRARCGDGILQMSEDEECDDGNKISIDGCSNRCQVPVCGNGVREGEEECDDGNQVDTDACKNGCQLPSCGNAVMENGEECDEGPRNSDTRPNTCRLDCHLPICGDGVRDEGEECDGSDSCTEACTVPGVLKGSGGSLIVGAIVLTLFGILSSLAYVFRKTLFGWIKVKSKGGGYRSIDDIPLDEIEMPWHQW